MKQEFKQLKGMRIMISLPKKEESKIKLDPLTQNEVDREFAFRCERMEVYAVGENVTDISIGDTVFIPTEELKRGTFIEIGGEQKLIINSFSVSLIW